MKKALSITSGKHRRYTCKCGAHVSVSIPVSKAKHKCGSCGQDLKGCDYTIEDLSVRRREDA